LPDQDRPVDAAGGQPVAVGTECQRGYCVLVAMQRAEKLPGRGIAEENHAGAAQTCRQHLTVRAESKALLGPAFNAHRPYDLAAGGVKQLERSVDNPPFAA